MNDSIRWTPVLLAVLLLTSVPAAAQSDFPDFPEDLYPEPQEPRWRFNLSPSFAIGIPRGRFGDHVTHPAFGFTLTGLAGRRYSLLQFGADLGGFLYEPYTESDGTGSVVHYIISAHLLARVQPFQGRVRPYADAFFGRKFFASVRYIEEDGEIVSSRTIQDNAARSYGTGGGLNVHLLRRQPDRLTFDLGLRYAFGAPTLYLAGRNPGARRSRTDLLVAHLGINVRW